MNNNEIEAILNRQAIRAADLAARMEQGRVEGMAKVRASQDALRASEERADRAMSSLNDAMSILRQSR